VITAAGMTDPRSQQETYSYLFSGVAQAYLNWVNSDPRYPAFTPAYALAMAQTSPVPDYAYRGANIEGTGVYRISGDRGTSHFVEITVSSNVYSLDKKGKVVGSIALDDLKIGPDRHFEVVLSTVMLHHLRRAVREQSVGEMHRRALVGESTSADWEWQGRWFHGHVEPLTNNAHDIVGTIGVALDVTDERKLKKDILAAHHVQQHLLPARAPSLSSHALPVHARAHGRNGGRAGAHAHPQP